MYDDYDGDYDYENHYSNPWDLTFPHLNGKMAAEINEFLYELVWAFESIYSHPIRKHYEDLENERLREDSYTKEKKENTNKGSESEGSWKIDDEIDF